jgi:AcrR family transcriptional regulator
MRSSQPVGRIYNRATPATLRLEHRHATTRRIVAAARCVFVEEGYGKAAIEANTAAAGVRRAAMHLHFHAKFDIADRGPVLRAKSRLRLLRRVIAAPATGSARCDRAVGDAPDPGQVISDRLAPSAAPLLPGEAR